MVSIINWYGLANNLKKKKKTVDILSTNSTTHTINLIEYLGVGLNSLTSLDCHKFFFLTNKMHKYMYC